MRYQRHVFTLLSLILLAPTGMAAGTGLTYHGRIVKPDGNALESSAVQFTIQIRSPGAEACLLYQESQTIDMQDSGGAFSLEIGTNPATRVAASIDGGHPLNKIFGNRGTLTVPNCNFGNDYTPNVADGRLLYITFNDGSGSQTLSPQRINYVPFAIESMQVNGYSANQFLRVDSGAAPVLTPAHLTTLNDLFNGTLAFNTSGNITSNGTVSGVELRSSSMKVFNGANYIELKAPVLTGNVTFKLPATDGSAQQILQTDGAGNLSWATPNAALGFAPVNKAGDTMSGDLETQNLKIGANKYLTLANNGTNGSATGQMWFDSGVIKYFDGSSVKSLSTGSAPALPSITAGQVWVGNASNAAEAFSLSGDITSVSATGSVSVKKTTSAQANTLLSLDGSGVATANGLGLVNTGTVTLSAQTASSTYGLRLPAAAPTGNQILQSDVLGNLSWVSNAAVTYGFVNGGNSFTGNASLGLNDAYSLDILTNGASRVRISETGNVGIGTGSPNAPFHLVRNVSDFRFSEGADNVTPSILVMNTGGGGKAASLAAGTGSSVFTFDDSGYFAIMADTRASMEAGNAGAGTALMTVMPSGKVGIGTNAPGALLDLYGGALTVRAGTLTPIAKITGGAIISTGTDPAPGYFKVAPWSSQPTSGQILGGYRFGSELSDYAKIEGLATENHNPGRGAAIRFFTTPNGSISQIESLRIDSGGNIGIGVTSPAAKLEVSAEIKIAASGLVCSVSTAGSQRYNSTSKSMEYCNGTDWMDFSPPGTRCGSANANGDPVQLCKGVNPATSCPANYVQYQVNAVDAGASTFLVETTCIKQ